MARPERADSFSDDDLANISSLAANISLQDPNAPLPPPLTPAKSTPNGGISNLSNSPALALASSTPQHFAGGSRRDADGFGKGTLMSSSKQKASKSTNPLFYLPSNRPEHHRDRQKHASTPSQAHRQPAKPQLFSSMGPDAQLPEPRYTQSSYCTTSRPKAAYIDQTFYMDPVKADADLKALLEGGLDDGADDDAGAKSTHLDDGTLEGMKVKLLPHQVEGVKWMKNRELGPVKSGKVPKGGILADDMGLGKTLQSIALIISNPRPEKSHANWTKDLEGVEKSTLVVAPLALIRQWEQEIKEKVSRPHQLSVCVHHGPNRTKRYQDLAKYDVVITTYQIVLSEHGNCTKTLKAGCFGLHWYRVVLDEAHTIKNRNAKSTKACYELDSEFRWCLTGTPMQNNLDELQSLVQFLRISPYDDVAHWRVNIDKPMKSGQGHIALGRLHALLRSFMKRRTKDILKEEGALLPGGKQALRKTAAENGQPEASTSAFKITERKVVSVKASFSPAERKFYDKMERRADERLEVMLKNKVNYANAFVLLLRLRQACNHPRLISTRLSKDKDALVTDTSQRKVAEASVDDLADAFRGMGIQTKKCEFCVQDLPKGGSERGGKFCDECAQIIREIQTETAAVRESTKVDVEKLGKAGPVAKDKERKARRRNLILDSDDDHPEEGTWLVGANQRGALKIGEAGGTNDEKAEGEGESVGDEDSIQYSEDEDGSQLNKIVPKDKKTIQQYGDSSSGDESFVSVGRFDPRSFKSKKPSKQVIDSDDDEVTRNGTQESYSEDDDEGDEEDDSSEDNDDEPAEDESTVSLMMSSTKVREMLKILEREVQQHKFIIFSQFTSMLDLIEPYLESRKFRYVRYDGSMKNDAREESLYRLRNDAKTRILLCSLKCGSLGLNLTAATRVIIIEPFWNPFVEEQAIDRVHRLTQTIDVVVYKLTVTDTVEERILDLQEKKRLLAEHAIEGASRGGSNNKKDKDALKLSLEELLSLFKPRDGRWGRGGNGDEYSTTIAGSGGSNSSNNNNHNIVSALARQSKPIPPPVPKKKEDNIYGRRW